MGDEVTTDRQEGSPPQLALFELPTDGREVRAAGPHRTIYVHFESPRDVAAFAVAIGQHVTTETRWLRFPPDAQVAPPTVDFDDDQEDEDPEQAGLFGDGEWWEEH